MKKRTMILLFGLCVSMENLSFADTCPPAEGLDPNHLPAGWSLIVPPIFPGETYVFGEAVHSLNISFYYKQVICKYQACEIAQPFCPAFGILSDKTYNLPTTKTPPWHYRSTIGYTLTCRPPGHDTSICIFD